MYQTREAWLTQAIDLLRPEFVLAGAPLPASIRVACAETPNFSRHGLEVVALSDSQSSDRAVEITVSWTLDDPHTVLARLVHGLCAATHKLYRSFSRCSVRLLKFCTQHIFKITS